MMRALPLGVMKPWPQTKEGIMSSTSTAFVPTVASQTALFLVKATPVLSLIVITYCSLMGFVW